MDGRKAAGEARQAKWRKLIAEAARSGMSVRAFCRFVEAQDTSPALAVIAVAHIKLTLLRSAQRNGINPQEYLHDVLTRPPAMTNRQPHELTPGNWAAARKVKAA